MPRSRCRSCFVVCLLGVALALFVVPLTSQAIPRYAARYDQNCSLCHDDPTGGGKRTTYAAQYLWPVEMVHFPPDSAGLERIAPQLGKSLSVGCDLRTIYHESTADAGAHGFLQMEGNLYVYIDPDPRFALYLARGISGNYEVFGMARVLPAQGYLKIGRFVPPYGWRWADHTAFVREDEGFVPPTHTDVGLEAGLFPGRLSVQVAVTNGARGSLQDSDSRLAASGVAQGRFHLMGVACAAGGSFTLQPRDALGARRTGGGVFGSLDVWRLTLVGQMDLLQSELGDEKETAWVWSQEAAGRLTRGLDLLVIHDYLDPDIDWSTGARERWGMGAECRPVPALQMRFTVERLRVDAGPATAGEDAWQGEAQVHFLF